MPSFCAVASCELKYSHSENVSFHKFPLKNPKLLNEWIKFTNRGSSWTPSRWNSICSRHFDRSDFREYLSRKCLKSGAIPTISTNNNISYETYHISSASVENTRTVHSEHDDYSTSMYDGKASSEFSDLCRLCGDRTDNLTCNVLKSLDDIEISLMSRKCFPAINMNSSLEHSKTICLDCTSQLKQYSEFIDKVLAYQRELGEDMDSHSNGISNSNRLQCDKESTSTPGLFIKQEPVNVKQEGPFITQTPMISPNLFSDSKKNKAAVRQDISSPNSAYCKDCDRIFANSNEFRSHKCSNIEQFSEREQGNNCEIMEVITLNNPVSYIDLADDENAINTELRKPKTEGLNDFERRERLEFEHAYAKRATSTSCNLKQEILDSYNDTSQNGYEQFGDDEYNYLDESNQSSLHCQKCNQVFLSQELLDEHSMNMHQMKPKICSLCNAGFDSSYEYLIHKNKMHTQRFQCKQCRRKFYSQHTLKIHERLCTRESEDYCFSCRHCGKNIQNLMVMKKHLFNCMRKPADATDETSQFQKMSRSKIEPKNVQTSSVIPEFKNFVQENVVDRATDVIISAPILNLSDIESETKQSFKFMIDDSKFIFLNESKMTDVSEPNVSANSGLNGKFACDTCGQPFSSFAHLKHHKTEHDSERKFSCKLCPKTFKGISGLKQHISGFHYKIKPYTCPVCKYAYALKGDMQRCRHSKLKTQNSMKMF